MGAPELSGMLADSGGVTGTSPGCEPSVDEPSLPASGAAAGESLDGRSKVTDEDASGADEGGAACGWGWAVAGAGVGRACPDGAVPAGGGS